ncbi:MAG: EAL domain-containing protein [Thiotrichales bacterium]|jgi:diguanylate cyclase (GGDEF)-like protein/PAS domain S-box-containing protein|nr:EAL domain-containing protein [Thiotrichales bacterium]
MPKVHAGGSFRPVYRPNYANALLSVWQNAELQPGQESLAYARIIEVAQHMLHVDHASIWVLQPNENRQTCLVLVKQSPDAAEASSIDIAQMPLYVAQLWQDPIVACDQVDACVCNHEPIWEEVYPYLTKDATSVMHVRLMADGQLLGVLRLEMKKAHRWAEDEKIFAKLLAEQVVHLLQHEDRARIQQELELISCVFKASRDAIVVISNVGIVQQVNPAFTHITGFLPEEVVGKHYPSWVNQGGQTEVNFDDICALVTVDGYWHGELMQRRKDGDVQAVWQTMLSVRDAQGQIINYISIETDLSAHKTAQARVHYLSHFDSLTGMANRQLLHLRLAELFDKVNVESSCVAVIYIDIDDFKKVNLSMGHALGDQLLITIAKRLQHVQFGEGTWARLSADEFVYAGLSTCKQSITQEVETIIARLSEPFAVGGQHVRLTASVGVAFYPDDAMDCESILKAAQSAMRAAKAAGGNDVRHYVSLMTQQAEARLHLEVQLARAIKENQLMLHYQPKYALADAQLIGVEALLRWHHPELGWVAPSIFIPLAEETGLIEEIGDWVLEEACRQLAAWQQAGLPLVPVAINVSASQFIRQPICDRIRYLLGQYQVSPTLLELELTERVVMHDPMQVKEIMQRLSELGVQLSIDDFGTGYSSLSYLQKFPLDKLKIDMSFVHNMLESKDSAAIARAIVQLGKSMELTVIAEGIETQAQQAMLAEMGCEQGQGYHFSRPLSADALVAFMTTSQMSAQLSVLR